MNCSHTCVGTGFSDTVTMVLTEFCDVLCIRMIVVLSSRPLGSNNSMWQTHQTISFDSL